MTLLDENERREFARSTWQYRAIEATRGNQSQLGAILIAVLGKGRNTLPRFATSATITSDGFVQAGFVTKGGEHKASAFVGSVRELCDNFSGLADHLQLTDGERIEMFAKVRAWITLDYRADKNLHFTKTR